MQPQTPIERRSDRRDRRQGGSASAPEGLERRSGERRQLPRSRWQQWPSLLASAAFGVVVAVWMQSLPSPDEARAAASPTPARSVPMHVPRFTMAEAMQMRDEAERLTAAAVALDEHATQRWWPLRGALDAAAADPATAEDLRSELHATQAALTRLGL